MFTNASARPPCLLGLLCLLGFACGGGGGDGPTPDDDAGVRDSSVPPDASPPVDGFVPDMGIVIEDPADYRAAYAAMLCEAYFDCLNRHTYQFTTYTSGFASVEECASSNLMTLLAGTFMPRLESFSDGHVTFDAERAAECLEARRAFLCDEAATYPRVDDPCEGVFEGVRTAGETCREWECVDGYSCSTGGDCHGTCVAVMSSCPDCADDEWCDGIAGTCRALRAEGEPCTGSFACQDGLVCDAEGLSTGECVVVASRSAGEGCVDDDECAEGMICESDVCTAYVIEGEGGTCGDAACEPGLVCYELSGDPTGTCDAPHGLGDPCVDPIGDCGAGLYCDSSTDVCAETKANGESCAETFECASLFCDSATNECAAPPVCEIP